MELKHRFNGQKMDAKSQESPAKISGNSARIKVAEEKETLETRWKNADAGRGRHCHRPAETGNSPLRRVTPDTVEEAEEAFWLQFKTG